MRVPGWCDHVGLADNFHTRNPCGANRKRRIEGDINARVNGNAFNSEGCESRALKAECVRARTRRGEYVSAGRIGESATTYSACAILKNYSVRALELLVKQQLDGVVAASAAADEEPEERRPAEKTAGREFGSARPVFTALIWAGLAAERPRQA